MAGKVVNKNTYQGDLTGCVYVGRPSPFGNPFTLSSYSRAEAISRYRTYVFAKIELDPAFAELVKLLYSKTLVCHCSPKACHADVLLEATNKLNGQVNDLQLFD